MTPVQPLKSEARILVALTSRLRRGSREEEVVLYAIVRGVRGIEFFGLLLGSPDDLMRTIESNPRFSEVRDYVVVRDLNQCRDIGNYLKYCVRSEVLKSLVSVCTLLGRILEELDKLITSADS